MLALELSSQISHIFFVKKKQSEIVWTSISSTFDLPFSSSRFANKTKLETA